MSQVVSPSESTPRNELYALHASFCQALRDPNRLLIVSTLPQLVVAGQSNASHQLPLIRHMGLVETRPAKHNVLFRLADPRIAEVLELPRASAFGIAL